MLGWRRWPWRRERQAADGSFEDEEARGIPAELLQRVRVIELRARRLVDDLFLGEYHAIFRGQGIEFDELRPYVVGDDIRSID